MTNGDHVGSELEAVLGLFLSEMQQWVLAMKRNYHISALGLRNEFYERRKQLQSSEVAAFRAANPGARLPARTYSEIQLTVRIHSGSLELAWKRRTSKFRKSLWHPLRWNKRQRGYSDFVLRQASRDWEAELVIEFEHYARMLRKRWGTTCRIQEAILMMYKQAQLDPPQQDYSSTSEPDLAEDDAEDDARFANLVPDTRFMSVQ